ncbi:MAG: hypothetical protein ACREQV_25840 [Candidatus Binatia bacterium]
MISMALSDMNKRVFITLLIVSAVGVVVALLVLVYQQFLGTRLPDLSEKVVGGKVQGDQLSSGTYELEYVGRTRSGQIIKDAVTFTVKEHDPCGPYAQYGASDPYAPCEPEPESDPYAPYTLY